jgi:hypothetical protein
LFQRSAGKRPRRRSSVLKGRIIRIISKKRCIINLGSDHGVAEGMEFGVFTPEEEITDPSTGEVLGMYRRQKTTLEPDEIYARFTVASRPTVYQSPTIFPTGTSSWPDLPVSSNEIKPLPSGTQIRVGDLVEELTDDELAADRDQDDEAAESQD